METYDISDYLPVSCSVLKNTRRKKEKVETLQVTQNTVILSEIAQLDAEPMSLIFSPKSLIFVHEGEGNKKKVFEFPVI